VIGAKLGTIRLVTVQVVSKGMEILSMGFAQVLQLVTEMEMETLVDRMMKIVLNMDTWMQRRNGDRFGRLDAERSVLNVMMDTI
jgi:hypothetical protein